MKKRKKLRSLLTVLSFVFFLFQSINVEGHTLLLHFSLSAFVPQDSLPIKPISGKYKIVHHGVEDGLSQGTTFSMLKDSRGFMWFTSYEGLNRFDGHQFKVYFESPRDSNSLKGSKTIGLVEDPYGNIWTGTEVCLNRYLRQSDQFDRLAIQDENGALISSLNYPFYTDSSEVWYINNIEGIMAYDYIKGEKRCISNVFTYRQSTYIYNSTVRTSDGMIWFRDEGGLACIDPNSGTHKWYFSDKTDNILGELLKLVCFYQDADGIIWLGYANGIIRFDYQAGEYKKINLDKHISTQVDDIKKDSAGILWLGTEQDGLLRYSESAGVIDHYRVEGQINHRLTNNAIIAVYVDDQELVWVNTDPEGVDVLIPDLKLLKKYSSDLFDPVVFSTAGVRTFLETTDGNTWIATQEEGVVVFNPVLDRIVRHIHPGADGFDPNSATCLFQDSQSRIWFGTYNGLYLSTNGGNDFQHIVNNSHPLRMRTSNFISHLLELSDKTILFSTEEGIYFIRPEELEPVPIDTLKDVFADRLHLTTDGYLLVSEGQNGFYALKITDWISPNNKKQNERFIRHFLPQVNIKHYCQIGNDSIIWIAANTGLLKARYEKDWSQLEIIKHFTRDDGLPSNSIYGILSDDNQKLWMSTNRGISFFDPITEIFTNYTIEDGLQGYEFNSNSFMKTSDGEFYFGGTNGFNRFYPDFKKNTIAPTLQITDFKVNDKSSDKENYIGEQEEIYLPFKDNTFFIQFSAIDYQSNGNNRYRAILENYDDTWTDLGYNNSIRYTKVAPGDYQFKVIAANNDGLWASQPKTLLIHIASPWYQTWWAYVVYLSVTSFILFQIYLIRKRRQALKLQLLLEQKEADRLKELDNFKTKFYSNITHEFRTPLTVIEGMANELENHPEKASKKSLSLIKHNSKKLLTLVNQMLDLSKLKAGKATSDLQQDDLIPFIKYFVETNESFANLQRIGLQFYAEEQEIWADFDAKKLEQILTNLISNALKFTPEYGKVLVVAKKIMKTNQPYLELLVKDNGIGISSEQLPYIFDRFHLAKPTHVNQGSGIGLALVKELVTFMKGNIKVESELNIGTTFILHFPIRNHAPLTPKTKIHKFEPIAHQEALPLSEDFTSSSELPVLLIIEDNIDVTYYIATSFKEEYQIISSRNGKKGVEKALEVLPDIIISDVMMPEMDGFEVCKILKKDERSSHIPIILLTAKATSEDKLMGLRHGADAYLIKPFEKLELRVRLHKLLEIRKTLQKKYSSSLISAQPQLLTMKSKEDTFILKVEKIILAHLEEEDFSIDELVRELHLSRSQVHRKIKALTGKSTSIYVRSIRLHVAKKLLKEAELNVTEISYAVGFKSPTYFSQAFKEVFGESPSKYSK